MSKFTALSAPILSYIRINTLGVKIRSTLNKSWYLFHKVENAKSWYHGNNCDLGKWL